MCVLAAKAVLNSFPIRCDEIGLGAYLTLQQNLIHAKRLFIT